MRWTSIQHSVSNRTLHTSSEITDCVCKGQERVGGLAKGRDSEILDCVVGTSRVELQVQQQLFQVNGE